MESFSPICINQERLVSGYVILSIRNLNLIDFIRKLPDQLISELTIYWLEKDNEYITKATRNIYSHELLTHLYGLDIPIINMEFKMNDQLLINSNLTDEIFCRLPPDFEVSNFSNRIKRDKITTKAFEKHVDGKGANGLFVTSKKK